MKLRLRRGKKTPKDIQWVNELLTPEGVPLEFKVAGLGVRTAAQLTDILLTVLAAVAIVVFLASANITRPDTLWAISALLFFLIRIPYYVASELAWNGQTLGKRFMKIKVVANNGGSLTTHGLVVRNLMKEAEVLLPATLLFTLSGAAPVTSLISFAWILMALAIPLFNKRRRRLGDFIAGTYVIHLPEPILLKDLARESAHRAPGEKKFTFLTHHLDHYGTYELQTLEDILRAQGKLNTTEEAKRQKATVEMIVTKIRAKIGFAEAVSKPDSLRFLRAFYSAQRAHLEQRQLFGERRLDKNHAATSEDEPKN